MAAGSREPRERRLYPGRAERSDDRCDRYVADGDVRARPVESGRDARHSRREERRTGDGARRDELFGLVRVRLPASSFQLPAFSFQLSAATLTRNSFWNE